MNNCTLALAVLTLSLSVSAGWAGDCCDDKAVSPICDKGSKGDSVAPPTGGSCCDDKSGTTVVPAQPGASDVTPVPAGPTVDQAFASGIRTRVPLDRFSKKSGR